MSAFVGTRINTFAGDAALGLRTIVADNESAMILGIFLAATAADIVNFTDAAGTDICTLSVVANDTTQIAVPFLVSDGFIAEATLATSFITVIWRPDA